MKKIAAFAISASLALSLTACSSGSNDKHITGAGSSFIYPVLSVWAKDYYQQKSVQVNYQAIGSGGGLQQIYAKTVDFAASDMPLTSAQLKQHQLKQFPMIIGGIVLAVNLPNVKNDELTLDGQTVEKIYDGSIKYWDAAAIKKLNPSVSLPHKDIVTIHRADGSGTTFNFTNYLSKISPKWKKNVGASTVVSWPGNGIGAKGNAGVAAQISQTKYSIGYVEYDYAKHNNMSITNLKNSTGNVVTASADSFAAAAKNANYNPENGYYLILTNQPGKDSWPIVATTFVLLPDQSKNPQIRQEMINFFQWCYRNGSDAAAKLDYVAVPEKVYEMVLQNTL